MESSAGPETSSPPATQNVPAPISVDPPCSRLKVQTRVSLHSELYSVSRSIPNDSLVNEASGRLEVDVTG